ncbi:MAG: hypothetical protein PQJ61_08380 [Spirochaetales bacterium]|uniref:Uncharacterized protein n=1 Tax=Candidatus Thalassospirochaeta sargassi TaxID=3119039 RepID=A0AAJ1ICH8_9SPIO|nr:hypothetical protein [Spirochaetales bacterium]
MKKISLIIITILLVTLAGCTTTLGGVKDNPQKHAGNDVRINARIALEVPLPFLDYSLYQIKDDTDRMFLFTDKKYKIDDRIRIRVHVIGISDGKSLSAFEEIAQQTANYMVKHRMESEAKARALSQKLVRLMTTLGTKAEGSYFLIAY